MSKLYFASPFFRPDQVEREERMKAHLRNLGFEVFSPKENTHLSADANLESQEKTFQDNLEGIKTSDAVFAITDGKDMGTIWEAGYAYGIGKPVLYYAETLGPNGQFNLMLARSGKVAFLSQDQVTKESIDKAIMGELTNYEGKIE